MDLLITAHEATHERTRDRNTRIHSPLSRDPMADGFRLPTVGHIDSHSARFFSISTVSFIFQENDVRSNQIHLASAIYWPQVAEC
jgi:hypothetical protein